MVVWTQRSPDPIAGYKERRKKMRRGGMGGTEEVGKTKGQMKESERKGRVAERLRGEGKGAVLLP